MRCAFISIFLALNFNLWLSWESARPWTLLDDDGDFVKCYCCCCLVNGLLNSGYINSSDYFKVFLIALGVNNTILNFKVAPKILRHFQKRHFNHEFLCFSVLFHLINIRYKLSVIFQKLWHPGTRNRLNLSIMVVNLHQILSIGEVVDIDQIIGQKFKHSSTLNDSWWSIIFKVGTLSISLTSRNISTHQITNGNVWCINNRTKNELSLWLY